MLCFTNARCRERVCSLASFQFFLLLLCEQLIAKLNQRSSAKPTREAHVSRRPPHETLLRAPLPGYLPLPRFRSQCCTRPPAQIPFSFWFSPLSCCLEKIMFSFFPNICFSIFCASNFVPIFSRILFQQLIRKIFQMRCLPSLYRVSEIFF